MKNTLTSLIDEKPDDFVNVVYQGRKTPHVVSSSALRELGVSSYGFFGKGKEFLAHKDDVSLRPNIFVPIEKEETTEEVVSFSVSKLDATRGAIALAEKHGIDLSAISKEGRINKKDVEVVINGS